MKVTVHLDVSAAAAEVFAALVEPRLLERWIAADARLDASAGGEISFGWRRGGPLKVTAVEADRVLEFAWRFGDEPETIVRWELAGVGRGTRVTVMHSGFTSTTTAQTYEDGWRQRLGHLAVVASGRAVPLLTITSDETIVPQPPLAITEGRKPVQVANISLNTLDLDANRRFYVDFLRLGVRADHGTMLVLEGNLVIDAGHGNPPTTSAHVMLRADDLPAVERRASELGYVCGRSSGGELTMRDPDGRMVGVIPTDSATGTERGAGTTTDQSSLVGTWRGAWDGVQAATLTVHSATGDRAQVSYTYEPTPAWNVKDGGRIDDTATFADGVLTIALVGGGSITFEPAGDELRGTLQIGNFANRGVFTRA